MATIYTVVYTVEGNTSGGSTLVANGGGVAKKSYPSNYSRIACIWRPQYKSGEALKVVQEALKWVGYLEKKSNAKLDLSKVDYKGINDASGYNLIKLINKFPQTVVDAYEKVEPCFIVRLLMDMASEFNKFYTNNRIIDNGVVNMNNLAIVYATKIVFENGFKLVNIPAITKM